MAKLDYKLNGFAELHKVLEQLPERVQGRVQQNASSAGARVLRSYAVAASPRSGDTERSKWSQLYGRIIQNLRVIRLKRNEAGERQARMDTGNAFWAVILNNKVGSKHLGWFDRAVQAGTPTALEKVRDTMSKGIIKETDKLLDETGANRVR